MFGQSGHVWAKEQEGISTFPYLLEEIPVDSVEEEGIPQVYGLVPAKYDSRESNVITSIKDQGNYGTCWAFTTMSMLESDAIQKGLLSFDAADLSERHLVYYTYCPVVDTLEGLEGDSISCSSNDMSFLYYGGNMSIACRRLATWQGAALENAAPYEAVEEKLPAQVTSAYNDEIHLLDYYVYSKKDTMRIKNAIIDHGSVGISFFIPGRGGEYLNTTTSSYYYPYSSTTNHAVTIVGWDDNFPASSFTYDPGADGAWLVKNCWGKDWGDEGYFWLSYQDATIGNNVYVATADMAENYDNNYQYDGSILDDRVCVGNGETKIANLFTAHGAEGGAEELKAVSFSPYTVNLEYSVQIYCDMKDETDPESGKAMLSEPVTGMTQAAGLYTIPLDETVTLAEGQKFAVVITLSKPDSDIYIYTEGSRMYAGSVQVDASAKAGQSYLKNAGDWTDVGVQWNKNIRIKAYTDNIFGEGIPTPIPSATPTTGNTPPADVVPTPTPVKPTEKPKSLPFVDVEYHPGNWKYENIKYAYENGLMYGIEHSDGEFWFEPEAPLTRAMFAAVLYRMAGSPEVVFENRFVDVSEGKWYSDAIVWANDAGIVQGFPGGQFRPTENITREQIARMLMLYAKYQGEDIVVSAETDGFADGAEVSEWAKEGVAWAVGTQIMVGEYRNEHFYLKPKAAATRVEGAVLLSQYRKKTG